MSQKKENHNQCQNCSLAGSENEVTIREEKLKSSLITRLNRVEGQIRGIKGMVERDTSCNDVLNQI